MMINWGAVTKVFQTERGEKYRKKTGQKQRCKSCGHVRVIPFKTHRRYEKPKMGTRLIKLKELSKKDFLQWQQLFKRINFDRSSKELLLFQAVDKKMGFGKGASKDLFRSILKERAWPVDWKRKEVLSFLENPFIWFTVWKDHKRFIKSVHSSFKNQIREYITEGISEKEWHSCAQELFKLARNSKNPKRNINQVLLFFDLNQEEDLEKVSNLVLSERIIGHILHRKVP